jgi:DNA-binding MarR family transcriptional regulator
MRNTAASGTGALARDARALQAAVADLVRVYQFRDRDAICCHDISVTQCYALETLQRDGPLRLGELATRLFLDKSTTSRVVGTLVRKGYAERLQDPADGRARSIAVTRAGGRLMARISRSLVAQQHALLADLEDHVRAAVVDVVRRLAVAADARFRGGDATAGVTTPPVPVDADA